MENNDSYNKSISRLEEIVRLLESGECPLEDAMELFKESIDLIDKCDKKLKSAKQMIVELSDYDRNEEI